MTDLTKRLTTVEADYLAECEDRIERGLQTFVEVGTALAMIRDNKLYRAKYTTFALYCEHRWGFSDRRARQIIDAAEIGTIVPVENEGQARELARVPEAERAEVWAKANESTGGKPTAAAIREAFQPSRPDHPASRGEEADGQPASPGPATGSREADGDDAPEAAGSSPDGDGLAVGQPAGDSHSSSEAGEVGQSPSPAAGDSVEGSGETSTDGEEELRVPALQPDSSDAAGAPVDFPAAGAPVDPLDDPDEVERQHRIRSSESVAKALATLLLRLDPDPIGWLENTWIPDAFRERDLPRVRDAFTADGLRLIAKHIESIADRVDRDGGVL